MIQPGAVFQIPEGLARPPQRAFQENPPDRETRWLVIVSSEADCASDDCPNVLMVLLSNRTDLVGPTDVVVVPSNGGVRESCIAQTDIVVTVDKRELSGPMNGPRYRGTVMRDTLGQMRALLRDRLDLN